MNDQTSIKIENRNYIMACTPAIQTSAEIELIKRRIIGLYKTFVENDVEYYASECVASLFYTTQKAHFKDPELKYLYFCEFQTENKFVIKYPHARNYNTRTDKELIKYRICASLLPHPNVVRYFAALSLMGPERLGILMQDHNCIALRHIIPKIYKEMENLGFDIRVKLAREIALGMNYLHSCNPPILHRDLTSCNVLYDRRCVITNFYNTPLHYTDIVPPELQQNPTNFTTKTDVYFFGIILCEFLFGFVEPSWEAIEEVLTSPSDFWLNHLIKKCLDPNPESRFSFLEIISFLYKLDPFESIDLIIFGIAPEKLESIKQSTGFTDLIHQCCAVGNLDVLKFIVSNYGRDYLYLVNELNFSCAHFAARNGQLAILQYLYVNGFDKFMDSDIYGRTPFLFALTMEHSNCIRFYIERFLNQVYPYFFASCQEGNSKYVELFFSNGLSVYTSQMGNHTYPLFHAILGENSDIVASLLKKDKLILRSRIGDINPLIAAVGLGNSKIVRTILEFNPPYINEEKADGMNPLLLSIQIENYEIAELLLEKGANVNHFGKAGFTPLTLAASKTSKKLVQLLLNYGALLEQALESGATALFIASENGCLETTKLLLERGANPNCSNLRRYSPLDIAIENGRSEIVKELLKYSANPNARTHEDNSPLFAALQLPNDEIVFELLKYGADPNNFSNSSSAPLFLSCKLDHTILRSKALLDQGADPNRIRQDLNESVLCSVVGLGKLEFVKLLLNYGAKPNLVCNENVSPLYIACNKGYLEIVQELLKAGANPNLVKLDGTSPLWIASKNGQTTITSLLLQHGANPLLLTDTGSSPLHIAAQSGHLEIVKVLIESSSLDINQEKKSDGTTALFLAALQGYVNIVSYLLKNGAKVDCYSKRSGKTPLFAALQNGNLNIIQELLQYKADPNHSTKDGFLPLYIAINNSNLEAVKILLSFGANPRAYVQQKQLVTIAEEKKLFEIVWELNKFI